MTNTVHLKAKNIGKHITLGNLFKENCNFKKVDVMISGH